MILLSEDAVFQKTCKIHRQLPPGGILVFLTGKQEIVRMVNRLRRALRDDAASAIEPHEVDTLQLDAVDEFALRDMDDDEMDGDLWQVSRDEQEKPDDDAVDLADEDNIAPSDVNGNAARVKLKATILPLYSLLSTEEQARVFAPVSEGYRLIVVATNIAETSITIPGITYVVDSGRQKCRNYNASTGVASFDVMWISQAAADQRTGRAGRTGPGHCYRLYSSSLYARQLDPFALPEVLTRPLEDVILSMKAMKISNVNDFPFPTPPDRSQIDAALQLLGNIGCVDLSSTEQEGQGDGSITRLGTAVARLPLGVRYSKILLVAAEAGVLDYAIPMVAALSEASPFVVNGQLQTDMDHGDKAYREPDDSNNEELVRDKEALKANHRWSHKGGDVLAAMLAVGAYTYAGRGAGGLSEKLACQKFCYENRLHPVIMERIQQMRRHLCHLSKSRLPNADGVASQTGGYVCSMPPPNRIHEQLLCQSIASGFLDNVAMLAPLGSIPGQHPFSLRSAYLSCSSKIVEPLFIDTNSVVYSRDARRLPKWICYETLIRKTLKDGVTSIAIMKKITPIDPSWLGRIAEKSRLLKIGEPIVTPLPMYDSVNDVVICSVRTKFGCHGWEIPPIQRDMFRSLEQHSSSNNSLVFMPDDSFRWFARFLLEGKVFPELQNAVDMLNDPPSILTRRSTSGGTTSHTAKVTLLVSALSHAGVDSASALRKYWAEVDAKFLFPLLKRWVQPESAAAFQKIWIQCVNDSVSQWHGRGTTLRSDGSDTLYNATRM
jgi:ATP-dependent RNA helicase DHX37/DHR1